MQRCFMTRCSNWNKPVTPPWANDILPLPTRYLFCSLLPACKLRAGIVFAGICVSVCTMSQKLLIRNWCNLVGICPMVNARGGWKLVSFDLGLWHWELFSYFSSSGYTSQTVWPNNFTFSMVMHLISSSRSWFSFKVTGPRSRSLQCQTHSVQP